MFLEETWLFVLRTVLLVGAFSGFAWTLLAARRDTALGFAQLAQQHMQALAEIQRLSERLAELNDTVQQLQLPVPVETPRFAPPPTPHATPSGARGYEMAIRLARGGASVEEIVANCGTTRSEARLLRRLHCAGGASAA